MRHTQNRDEILKPGDALIEVQQRRYARGSGEGPRWEFMHYSVERIEKETAKRLHLRHNTFDKETKKHVNRFTGSAFIYTLVRYEPLPKRT